MEELINEAINDVHVIVSMNPHDVAKRLIKDQFIVISKEDLPFFIKGYQSPSIDQEAEAYAQRRWDETFKVVNRDFFGEIKAAVIYGHLKAVGEDGWVKVEDELPTEKDADEDGIVDTLYWRNPGGWRYIRGSRHYKDIHIGVGFITHWRKRIPLPTPPKQ